MTWFLGYVAGGHTTKAEAGDFNSVNPSRRDKDAGGVTSARKMRRQFYVERELNREGIEAWVAKEIKFMRAPNSRHPEPHELPYLPNYIFINTPDDRFRDVLAVKYLASNLMALRRDDTAALTQFRSIVDGEYNRAKQAARNRDAISEYVAGQALQTLDDRFEGEVLRFVRMVQGAHDQWPMVRAELEMMGRSVKVDIDPLNVRASE